MGDDNGMVVDRRTVIAGTAVTASALALSACADDAEPESAPSQQSEKLFTLTTVAQVPVGGVISVPGPQDEPVLVSQPEQGVIKAFDATCTHKGCTVNAVETTLQCPCHGAAFDPSSGAPIAGPAPSPLAPVEVHVDDQGNVHAV